MGCEVGLVFFFNKIGFYWVWRNYLEIICYHSKIFNSNNILTVHPLQIIDWSHRNPHFLTCCSDAEFLVKWFLIKRSSIVYKPMGEMWWTEGAISIHLVSYFWYQALSFCAEVEFTVKQARLPSCLLCKNSGDLGILMGTHLNKAFLHRTWLLTRVLNLET